MGLWCIVSQLNAFTLFELKDLTIPAWKKIMSHIHSELFYRCPLFPTGFCLSRLRFLGISLPFHKVSRWCIYCNYFAKMMLPVFIQIICVILTSYLASSHCFPFPICCRGKDLQNMLDTHQLSTVPLSTSEIH